MSSGEIPKEYARKIRPYIEKALAIDNSDPVVRASAAIVYWQIGEHHLASRYIDAAIALNPNDANVMFAAVLVLSWLGKSDECLNWCEKLMRLDIAKGDKL